MSNRRTIKDNGPDPIDRYVGARVRQRRAEARISQTTLGKQIGVTFQQIQKYENGTNRIGASNLFKIAHILGVAVVYFYEGIDPKDLASLAAAPAQTEADRDLARQCAGLDDQQKRLLARFAREMRGTPGLAAAAE